ncbi:MAG TPA: hypothetical protein VKA34_20800 [Balneolales bacterium]|nr:hypothetical protein [Balneolales bacterium]
MTKLEQEKAFQFSKLCYVLGKQGIEIKFSDKPFTIEGDKSFLDLLRSPNIKLPFTNSYKIDGPLPSGVYSVYFTQWADEVIMQRKAVRKYKKSLNSQQKWR